MDARAHRTDAEIAAEARRRVRARRAGDEEEFEVPAAYELPAWFGEVWDEYCHRKDAAREV